MFDMGPYYLTSLIALIGPLRRVTGMTRITFPQRRITTEGPKYGGIINVEVPTHINGLIEFQTGAMGVITTSYDIFGGAKLPWIEIYGSEGTLSVPDPNTFNGPVRIRREGETEWSEVPLSHGFTVNERGLGVADLAHAVITGRQHRCNGDMAYHVLEAMHGFHIAADMRAHYKMSSTCESPAPLPINLSKTSLEL